MCVLRERAGEVGRLLELDIGGGVMESARGLLCAEGEGDTTGDEGSIGVRHVVVFVVVTRLSSSDVVFGSRGSSSFNNDETSGGSATPRPVRALTVPFVFSVAVVA